MFNNFFFENNAVDKVKWKNNAGYKHTQNMQ